MDSEENQNQVSHRCPRALGNRCRDFHIPAAPAMTAVGKWKSKNRIPTFPQRLPGLYQIIKKRKEINPKPRTSSFRLISGLENADIPSLRELLTQLLPGGTPLENFEVDHDFPSIGHKSMILNARQIHPRADGAALILLAIEDATLRERADRARLEGAREEERRLIASELHDDLVQQLAGLAMDIGSRAAKAPGPSSRLKKELRSLQTRAVRAAEAARQVAYKLHPTELDDLGLETALRLYCEELGQREGIAVKFSGRNLPQTFSREIAYCLYKVAQESLRNVAKHSQAKRATVSVEGTADGVRLGVEDFGGGFSVSSLKTTSGLGILSMRERVHLANGKFSIASEQGKGTRISVEIPLENAPLQKTHQ